VYVNEAKKGKFEVFV